MKRNLIIVTLTFLLLIVLPLIMITKAKSFEDTANTGCGYPPLQENPPLGRKNTWTQNTQVKVFIADAFTDDQENGIKEAFISFQDAKAINTSGVSFDIIVGNPANNQTGSYCQVKAQIPPNGGDEGASGRGQEDSLPGNIWLR